MGYDLHITRKEFWSDEDGPTIRIDEWIAYLNGDPEIEADPENPGLENWRLAKHPEKWPLWWDRRGEIYTKNPDSEVIKKMVQIAESLHARVLGDDDEIYGTNPQDPTQAKRR